MSREGEKERKVRWTGSGFALGPLFFFGAKPGCILS